MSGVLISELFSGNKWFGSIITFSFPENIPTYYVDGEIADFFAFTDDYKEVVRSVLQLR